VGGGWFSGTASEPIRLQHGEKDARKGRHHSNTGKNKKRGKERKAVEKKGIMKNAEGMRVV
jgi:hypothetical protein